MTDPNPMSLFGPVVDGHSLPRHPFDPDAPAITANIPMMIGTTSTETTNLLGRGDPQLFSLNEAEMRLRLKTFLGVTDASKLDLLIATYRKELPNASPSDIYFAVTSDQMVRIDAIWSLVTAK